MDKISSIAVTIADKLIAGGVTLSFKEDSLLAPAGGELEAEMPTTAVSTEEIADAVNEANVDTSNPFLVPDEQEELEGMGDVYGHCVKTVVEPIQPMVAGIISRIRDSIIPTTNDIFEKAYAGASEVVDNGGVKLTIVTDGSELPIWRAITGRLGTDRLLLDGETPIATVTRFSFPPRSVEDIIKDLHSIVPEYNEMIDVALSQVPGTHIQGLYNHLFNVYTGEPVAGVVRNEFMEPKLQALVSSLLAHCYKEEIPDGIEGVNLADFNYVMDGMIAHHSKKLFSRLTLAENGKLNGTLILEYPAQDAAFLNGSKIVVNGLVYDEWLEAGGTVDAIYGAYIVGGTLRRGTDILERQAELERAWVRRVGLAQSEMADRFGTVFVGELRRGLAKYAEETGMKVSPKAIDMAVNRNVLVTPDNAYNFTRGIVIEAFYQDGDHNTILAQVDHLCEKVKGIELADAINIAITDWLVNWALSQVNVGTE